MKHQITPIYGHEYSIKSLTLRGKEFRTHIVQITQPTQEYSMNRLENALSLQFIGFE